MPMPDISPRRIGAILIKEVRQLRRDRPTLAMMVMIRIIQLLLFGYAINTDPKHMPTTLVVEDHSLFARSIIAGLTNTDYFSIARETSSETYARSLLQEGLTQFVITIPEDFGRDLVRGQKPSVLVETDATDPTASSGALAALPGVIDRIVRHDMTGPLAYLKNRAAPFQIEAHRLYNPEGFSRYNIVPGLMGIILTMTGVMMTALALTRERERGTMENLLSMPVSPFEIMIGKIAPYVIICYAQSAMIILAAAFLFDVPVIGSLPLLASVLLVFIVCNLALGFTVSAGARNQMQAMQLSFVLFMPSVLLSGYMFPFHGMPKWAQMVGESLPATYFIRIVRGIMLKGDSFAEIIPNLWPLMVFMAVISAVAMKLYRRTLD